MLDTLTKPLTQLKALKLVPEGSIKKNARNFLTYDFSNQKQVTSFYDRARKQFLEVPLKE